MNLHCHLDLPSTAASRMARELGRGLLRRIRNLQTAAVVVILAALSPMAMAQDSRGPILVINDWRDTAEVTLLMERREEIVKTSWNITPGNRSYLSMVDGGRHVRVSARDRIKIRSDSRAVAIGDVGRFRDGEWQVRVRDVFEAQRERDHRRPSQQAPVGRGNQPQFEYNTDRVGGDYSDFELRSPDPALCSQACQADSNCQAWTYGHPNLAGKGYRPHCWLKNVAPNPNPDNCCVSGVN
jgi:hypothetical protein